MRLLVPRLRERFYKPSKIYKLVKAKLMPLNFLSIDGDPLSVHPNINFGLENVLPGLKSPTYSKKLEVGEIITVGMGYRRALVARTGLYARNKEEVPSGNGRNY
jgi:hypothetical protein